MVHTLALVANEEARWRPFKGLQWCIPGSALAPKGCEITSQTPRKASGTWVTARGQSYTHARLAITGRKLSCTDHPPAAPAFSCTAPVGLTSTSFWHRSCQQLIAQKCDKLSPKRALFCTHTHVLYHHSSRTCTAQHQDFACTHAHTQCAVQCASVQVCNAPTCTRFTVPTLGSEAEKTAGSTSTSAPFKKRTRGRCVPGHLRGVDRHKWCFASFVVGMRHCVGRANKCVDA